MNKRAFVKRTDFIVLFIVLLVSALGYWWLNSGSEGAYAEVLYNNEPIERISLKNDGLVQLKDFPNVIFEVRDGAVCFKHSDCPDKICVNTGYIKSKGQSAVCLPNRLTLRIVGEGKTDTYTN